MQGVITASFNIYRIPGAKLEAAGVDCCALLYDHRMTNPMIKILPALLTLAALATEPSARRARSSAFSGKRIGSARRAAPGRSRTTTPSGKVIHGGGV